eukprot:8920767-Ditylum_brightwellii.AAC.1
MCRLCGKYEETTAHIADATYSAAPKIPSAMIRSVNTCTGVSSKMKGGQYSPTGNNTMLQTLHQSA